MASTNVPLKALPCIILAMLEAGEMVEIVSAAQCSVNRHLGPAKLLIVVTPLWLRIVKRYPIGLKFEDMEPFVIKVKGVIDKEKMMDNEAAPLSWKRPREASYKVDNEVSDARSHDSWKNGGDTLSSQKARMSREKQRMTRTRSLTHPRRKTERKFQLQSLGGCWIPVKKHGHQRLGKLNIKGAKGCVK